MAGFSYRSTFSRALGYLIVGTLFAVSIIVGPPIEPRPLIEYAKPLLFDLPTMQHVMLAGIGATGVVAAILLFANASRADRAMRFRRFAWLGTDRRLFRYAVA